MMNKLNLYLLTIIFFYSCAQITTQEQRNKYGNCKKDISDPNIDYRDKFSFLNLSDSTLRIINDIPKLSLDEIIYKYEIQTDKIDDFIKFICMLNEAQSANEILEERLPGATFEEKQKIMDDLLKSTFGS